MNEVFLVSAARTAIGTFGGSLKGEKPGELGAKVAKEAMKRGGVAPELVENVVFGNVVLGEPRDGYTARIAGIGAGIPETAPALTLNRLCGSGLQAIITAAQGVMLGDHEIALGGGTDIMSRAAYYLPALRFGQKMGNAEILDGLNGALTDPFNLILMGVTAENVAERYGITREMQDELALESQKRATNAIAQGYFKEQILPIEVKVKRQVVAFDTDEFVRTDATAEGLAKLKPIFKKDGTVTAGNASGINDGAGAVVLASGEAVKKHGLKPMMRLVSYGVAGVDPAYMGIGPVPATRQALAKAGLTLADLDVIEANEAFAAQACAVANELGFDMAKVNPNGSGISLGHPIGATGAILTTKLAYELQRSGGRYGLVTMCIGGGQGIAAIWERC